MAGSRQGYATRLTTTQQTTDQQMLDWLRDKLADKYREGGASRHFSDTIIARFAELIENQATTKRILSTVEDAHKLAMNQMQFAQSALRQFERQIEKIEKDGRRNGTPALPASDSDYDVDLQGQ